MKHVSRILSTENNNMVAGANTANATVNMTINREVEVKYGEEPCDDITVIKPTFIIPNEAKVYKAMCDAYVRNPTKINNFVIMKATDLANLIKLLTDVKEVQVEEDIDITCCSKQTNYNTVSGIVCIREDGTRVDFEIEYNKQYRLLYDYKISTKITCDEY